MHYLDYNERRQHGTSEFPMAFYLINEAHPRYHMTYHWHREYEIIRIVKGTLNLSLDSQEMKVSEGDIVFIHDGIIHGATPEGCIYECIVFDLSLLLSQNEACRSCLNLIASHQKLVQDYFPVSLKEKIPIFFHTAEQLFHCAAKPFCGMELIVTGMLTQLIGIIFQFNLWKQEPSDNIKTLRNQKKIEQLRAALNYIDNHYQENITLEQLSAEAGMSPKYFCHFFESIIHKTPIEYLNYYRIERACYELSLGNISVTEAGFNCGFHDTSYFIRMFKREKGITPKRFQANLQ